MYKLINVVAVDWELGTCRMSDLYTPGGSTQCIHVYMIETTIIEIFLLHVHLSPSCVVQGASLFHTC